MRAVASVLSSTQFLTQNVTGKTTMPAICGKWVASRSANYTYQSKESWAWWWSYCLACPSFAVPRTGTWRETPQPVSDQSERASRKLQWKNRNSFLLNLRCCSRGVLPIPNATTCTAANTPYFAALVYFAAVTSSESVNRINLILTTDNGTPAKHAKNLIKHRNVSY